MSYSDKIQDLYKRQKTDYIQYDVLFVYAESTLIGAYYKSLAPTETKSAYSRYSDSMQTVYPANFVISKPEESIGSVGGLNITAGMQWSTFIAEYVNAYTTIGDYKRQLRIEYASFGQGPADDHSILAEVDLSRQSMVLKISSVSLSPTSASLSLSGVNRRVRQKANKYRSDDFKGLVNA